MPRRLIRFAFGFSVSLLLATAARGEDTNPVTEGLKEAQRDGRPVLIMASRKDCPLCASLKARMSKDTALKPLAVTYVTVQVDVDGPAEVMQDLAKRRELGGNLPFLYILRADGQLISATLDGSRAPLEKLLNEGLTRSGHVLTPAEVPRVEAAMAKTRAALEHQDVGRAVTALTPLLKVEGYAASLVEARKTMADINAQAKAAVAECEKAVAGEDKLAAAVLLSDANRKYLRLPEQKKAIAAMIDKLRKEEGGRELMVQADEIVKARGYARFGNKSRSTQAFEQLIKKYPDSAVAKFAAKEIGAPEPAAPAEARAAAEKAPPEKETAEKKTTEPAKTPVLPSSGLR